MMQCNSCTKVFKSEGAKNRHFVKEHTPWFFQNYLCEFCQINCYSLQRLKIHCATRKHILKLNLQPCDINSLRNQYCISITDIGLKQLLASRQNPSTSTSVLVSDTDFNQLLLTMGDQTPVMDEPEMYSGLGENNDSNNNCSKRKSCELSELPLPSMTTKRRCNTPVTSDDLGSPSNSSTLSQKIVATAQAQTKDLKMELKKISDALGELKAGQDKIKDDIILAREEIQQYQLTLAELLQKDLAKVLETIEKVREAPHAHQLNPTSLANVWSLLGQVTSLMKELYPNTQPLADQ